jgi:hypothetical protein
VCERRVLPVLIEIRLSNDGPAFHRPMALCAGKRVGVADWREGGSENQILRGNGAQRIHVEPDLSAHPPGPLASIAQG